MKYFKSIIFIAFFVSLSPAFAQDKIDSYTEDVNYFPYPYVLEGRVYKTVISDDQTASFTTTLFGGNQYRIALCKTKQRLAFSIYDIDKNLLFSTKQQGYVDYWDFKIKNTMPITIEIELKNKKNNSSFACLQIGVKQKVISE